MYYMKKEVLKRAVEVLNILKQELPKSFRRGVKKRPLKIGIREDLLAFYKDDERFTPQELQNAIKIYTHGQLYLQGLVEGVPRFSLEGRLEGKVTAEQALRAQESLAERQAKSKSPAELDLPTIL